MQKIVFVILCSIAVVTTPAIAKRPSASKTIPTPALVDGEIQIDSKCRVLTPARPNARDSSPRFRSNSMVCHFESVHVSNHREPGPPNSKGKPTRVRVTVYEREYVLQNTTGNPVTFVVYEPLKEGWSIDSDPQPFDVTDTGATFRVEATPGEIVRLHVGSRN